ncbi:MAG: PEP-CTERM sorting domain-containing protein [Armatimonadota bacterium]
MRGAAIAVVLLLAAAAGSALAADFTPSVSDLQGMGVVMSNPSGNSAAVTPTGTGISVSGTISNFNPYPPEGTAGDFGQLQVGYKGLGVHNEQYPMPPHLQDLSAFAGYDLVVINNTGSVPIMANLFMNTGWTDSPHTDGDHYYQNGWAWVNPGESRAYRLDFLHAERYSPSYAADTSVEFLNRVTAIGFNVGANDPGGGASVSFTVGAAPVPEPGTLALLACGATGLVPFLRRRKR